MAIMQITAPPIMINQHFIDGAVLEELSGGDSTSSSIEFAYGFTQRDLAKQDTKSILLDTGSNCSVFNNPALLQNIRNSDTVLRAFTNGGFQDSFEVEYFPGFFDVWYNRHSMVNILSFAEVSARYRVTLDTADRNAFHVHMDDGSCMVFHKVMSGLYMFNDNITNESVTHYSYLNLVDDNKKIYSRRELEGANTARALFRHTSVPTYSKFIKLIEQDYFRNSPVTTDDVKRAIYIYGKDTAFLQGKSTRNKASSIHPISIIPLPHTIQDAHRNIQLSVDYIYIQGIAMLHTTSGGSYQFRTIEPIFKLKPNKSDILRGIQNVLKHILAVVYKYNRLIMITNLIALRKTFFQLSLTSLEQMNMLVISNEQIEHLRSVLGLIFIGFHTDDTREPWLQA